MERRSNWAKVNFMIVDDNAFMRTTLRRILEYFGAQRMQEAPDGTEALKIMQNWEPDIVLLDWEMSPLNGIEFTKMLRSSHHDAERFVPVILISGHSEQWRIAEARDAGVTEYLAKPVSAKSVLSRIRTVVEQPRPFINAPNYFGPDRRRRTRDCKFERRTLAPNEVPYNGLLSQVGSPHLQISY
ncbi:MAG: response regulator [Rhodospirillales bacterium]|nr:response regulator [Rhodospirillales bacterium]